MNMVAYLSWFDLLWVALLLAISGGISLILRLRLESKLLIAGLRTVVQLTILGFILEWVFQVKQWLVILAMLTLMLILGSFHALRRASWVYRGSHLISLLSLGISTFITAAIVTQLVIEIRPWYDPQYLIPLVGMILGNSLTGISLGIDQFLGSLKTEKSTIEDRLFMGASRWEAALPQIRKSIFHGHIPILNAMTVAGIVSLPGMMTGQILAGSSPMLAVKYQIVVMFMIAAACSLGTMTFILISARQLFTPWHQLDEDRIVERK